MKKLTDFIKQYWPLMLLTLAVAACAYVLLFYSLGSLLGGYSIHEVASKAKAASLSAIVQNPANAPYSLLVWVSDKIGYESLLATRLIAGMFALIAAALFYWIVLHWYSKRIAIISTIMFVSSSGYLHFARYGTALVLQMATLALMASVWLYQRAKREYAVTYLIVGMLAVLTYIPGMIWFQLLGLVVLRKQVVNLMRRLGTKHVVLLSTMYVILIAPIIWASIHSLSSLLHILGLPTTVPSWSLVLQNAGDLVNAIVYHGYYPSDYWLYGAPLLSIAEAIFFIAGLLYLFKRPVSRTNFWLLMALAISSILVVLGGGVAITMLVPLIYLVIAGGVYYLLDQWLSVFPRNPIARATGIGVVCLVVAFSVYYHFRAYYIAWPRAPETERVYIIKQ